MYAGKRIHADNNLLEIYNKRKKVVIVIVDV